MYPGEIADWKELGGPDEQIPAIARGSRLLNQRRLHEDTMRSKSVESPGVSKVASSNTEVITALADSNRVIAYLGLSYTEDGAAGL